MSVLWRNYSVQPMAVCQMSIEAATIILTSRDIVTLRNASGTSRNGSAAIARTSSSLCSSSSKVVRRESTTHSRLSSTPIEMSSLQCLTNMSPDVCNDEYSSNRHFRLRASHVSLPEETLVVGKLLNEHNSQRKFSPKLKQLRPSSVLSSLVHFLFYILAIFCLNLTSAESALAESSSTTVSSKSVIWAVRTDLDSSRPRISFIQSSNAVSSSTSETTRNQTQRKQRTNPERNFEQRIGSILANDSRDHRSSRPLFSTSRFSSSATRVHPHPHPQKPSSSDTSWSNGSKNLTPFTSRVVEFDHSNYSVVQQPISYRIARDAKNPLRVKNANGSATVNHNYTSTNNLLLTGSASSSSSSSSTSSSSSSSASSDEFYNQEWNIHLIWYSVFGVMILIGLLGNVLIIATITGHKSLHTVTNVFLLNLTASDLVTLLFNATFNLFFMLHGHWPFGHVFCVVNNFMTNLTLALSVFTIMFTSKERYNAIVHPLRKRMTRQRAISHIILIWAAGTLFASPTLIYSRTVHQGQRAVCLMRWPDGYAMQSKIDFVYNLLFLVLLYLLPLMTMGIAYTLMARVLWGSEQIGESSQAQMNLIRSKQKVVRMLIYVVVVFGVCWLPYHLYFLTTHYWPGIVEIPPIQQIYLGIYWLAMSNSMLNPIILLVMNQRFRRYSIKFLNFWPCNQMFPFIGRASASLPSEALNTAIVCQGPNLETQTVLVCLDSQKSHLSFESSKSSTTTNPSSRASQRNGVKPSGHNKQIALRPTQSCRQTTTTTTSQNRHPLKQQSNGHHQNGS